MSGPGPVGALGPVGPIGGPDPREQSGRAKPDMRFRSFVERYVCARAQFFRVPPEEHAEDMWLCLQDAKRAYTMIRRASQFIDADDRE